MSIPSKILKAVAEPVEGNVKPNSAKLEKAAFLVQDFTQDRTLSVLDQLLESEDATDLNAATLQAEAAQISDQTAVLEKEIGRFLATGRQ